MEKKDNKGNPVRVIGTMRNITERKRYERELLDAKENIEKVQEVNQLILDHSNNGLVYLTTDFQVQWENVAKYSNHPLAVVTKPEFVVIRMFWDRKNLVRVVRLKGRCFRERLRQEDVICQGEW